MSNKPIRGRKETNAERAARLRYEFNKTGGVREQYWKAYAEGVKKERAKVGPGGKKGASVVREYDIFPETGVTPVRNWKSGKTTGGEVVNNLERMEAGKCPVTRPPKVDKHNKPNKPNKDGKYGTGGNYCVLHHEKELARGGTNDHKNLIPMHQTVHQKYRRVTHQGIHGKFSAEEERNRRQEKVKRAERPSKARTNRRGENVSTKATSRSAAAKSRSSGQKRGKTIPRKGARHGIVVEKGRGKKVEQSRKVSRLPKSRSKGRSIGKPKSSKRGGMKR